MYLQTDVKDTSKIRGDAVQLHRMAKKYLTATTIALDGAPMEPAVNDLFE